MVNKRQLAIMIDKFMQDADYFEYRDYLEDLEGEDPVDAIEYQLSDYETATEYMRESFEGYATEESPLADRALEILKGICKLHHIESEVLKKEYRKRAGVEINCFAYKCLDEIGNMEEDDLFVDEIIDTIHKQYEATYQNIWEACDDYGELIEDAMRACAYLGMVYASAMEMATEAFYSWH